MALDAVAITGGVAMQLGLSERGRAWPRGQIADLDLVAASSDAIGSGVVGPFLLSHYHMVCPGVPKFMIQLVDTESRLRVDVFPDLAGSLADARPIGIGSHWVPALPLDKIFDHKVQTLSRASGSHPIDPKHLDDARLLGNVLGRPVPHVASGSLAPDVFGIDDDGSCERCELSHHPAWPLAPKDRVFELLGWQPRACLRTTSGAPIARPARTLP